MDSWLQEGLEGVIAAKTGISAIDGQKGRLVYRGYWIEDIALQHSFEEAAYLLLYGALPTKDELAYFDRLLKEHRVLPDYVKRILFQLPKDMEYMSVLRTLVSALGDRSFVWKPTVEQAVQVISCVPTMISAWHRRQQGLDLIEPRRDLDHVENYLYMLTGNRPGDVHKKALEVYFILTMEHGMNASTFAARVTLSTESDLISALTAAIGTMKGPLHGGAPSGVIRMLEAIGEEKNAEPWLRKHLKTGERIMGFGHRVYKTHDPRSLVLKEITKRLAGQDHWLDLANTVETLAIRLLEEYKPGRKLYTNVEYYAAAVMRAIEMPSVLFTPTFTASRTVGWSAHILEQAQSNRLYRPESVYIGQLPPGEPNL